MSLKGTKTEANLMEAFSGESQARNKYTYYASKAKKEGYNQIADFFEETIILGANPKSVSNWLTTNVTGYLNKTDKNVSDISLTPKRLFELIELVDNGKISSKQSKDPSDGYEKPC